MTYVEKPTPPSRIMLVLRIVTASLIFHHGTSKILDWGVGFSTYVIAAYFPFLPFSPYFWTYLSCGFELVGSFCFVVGILVRPSAALIAGTMVVATTFQLMKFGLQDYPFGQPTGGGPAYTFEPSLTFLAVNTHLLFSGPGRFALPPHFPGIKWLQEHTHPYLNVFKEPLFGTFSDLGMLVLRIVTASLIFHHGTSKILDGGVGFSTYVIAAYFPFLPFSPYFWTYLSCGFELVGSFCFVVGILVRPSAALIAGTMVVATTFQLMKFGLQDYPFGQPTGGGAA